MSAVFCVRVKLCVLTCVKTKSPLKGLYVCLVHVYVVYMYAYPCCLHIYLPILFTCIPPMLFICMRVHAFTCMFTHVVYMYLFVCCLHVCCCELSTYMLLHVVEMHVLHVVYMNILHVVYMNVCACTVQMSFYSLPLHIAVLTRFNLRVNLDLQFTHVKRLRTYFYMRSATHVYVIPDFVFGVYRL